MRLRRVFVIAAIVVLLSLGAVIFVAFSDFGSSKEPVINGMRVRRYVAYTGATGSAPAIGAEAIPWLIKGLDAKDSAIHRLKVRVWKLLPRKWQSKWWKHEPINPRTLRINCMRALGMFGTEAAVAVPKLIELAKSDSSLDVVAFTALAQMAPDSPEARAFLVTSLRDGDGAVKTKVASTFGDTGFTPPEAVPLLVARLKNFVPPAQGSTLPVNEMSALSVCGSEAAPAAPFLAQYIERGRPGIGLRALRATGPAAVVALPRLLEILEEGDEWTTRLKPDIFAILAGLGTNGTAALPALTNGLSDANPVVRVLAVGGIANITGDVDFAVPRLIEQLQNRQRSGEISLTIQTSAHLIGLSHREIAAMLLGEFGDNATNALPSLKAIVTNRERGLYACVAEAIWKISRDTNAVLPPLIDWLQSSSEIRRMWSLNVLAQMGPAAEPAVPAIRAAMESNLHVRRCGYDALQRINSTEK